MDILLDVDGVLADFPSKNLTVLNEISGLNLQLKDVTTFDMTKLYPDWVRPLYLQKVLSPGFCASQPVYEGAVELVRRLDRLGTVYLVTTPWRDHPTWAHEREKWIQTHLGYDRGRVIHTAAKQMVEGDVFVDDKPINVRNWQARHPNKMAWLMDQPYNRDPDDLQLDRVMSLAEIAHRATFMRGFPRFPV